MKPEDLELLARYSQCGDERAFTALVQRHVDLVYSVAKRMVRSPQLAEEVAQSVFLDLAKNATHMKPNTILAAWLYRVTHRRAVDLVRRESRRERREQVAFELAQGETAADSSKELLLDDAMQRLAETDRAVIVLRFFQGKSLQEVGADLGISDDAAQKRVSRAVEQLRAFFLQRGFAATSAAGVLALLGSSTAKAAPAGLAAAISASVSTTLTVGAASATSMSFIKGITMTLTQKIMITAAVIAVAGIGLYETQQSRQAQRVAGAGELVVSQTGNPPRSSSSSIRNNRTSSSSNRSSTTAGDFRSQLESILRGTDPLQRNRELISLTDKLSPSQLKEALDYFHELCLGMDRNHERDILRVAWGKADPVAALESGPRDLDGLASRAIFSAWVARDPDAAIAWAQAKFTGKKLDPYKVGIIKGLAASDPVHATRLLNEMSAGQWRDDALTGILPSILSQGDQATRAWIAGLEDKDLRDNAIRKTAGHLAKTSPQAAADWLTANPCKGAVTEMAAILNTWMSKDPAAATACYESQPAGKVRSSLLLDMVFQTSIKNQQAAAALLDAHPEDATDSAYMQTINSPDPKLAFRYLPLIRDPEAQEESYEIAVENWLHDDPAAAKAFLETHPIPESARKVVQELLAR